MPPSSLTGPYSEIEGCGGYNPVTIWQERFISRSREAAKRSQPQRFIARSTITKSRHSPNGRKIALIDSFGRIYRTQREAAAALNIKPDTIRRKMLTGETICLRKHQRIGITIKPYFPNTRREPEKALIQVTR